MDPLDIALRKLLIFLELPKEAQQIDRLLTEFAKVYYEKQKSYYGTNCPWTNHNQVYFVIFSLLVLHTDYFNANNKQKMTRQEFITLVHEDTYSEGDKVPLEILAYYYDNIIGKESPKFDFSTYYSMLSPSTPSSIEFTYSENNSSEGTSRTSLLPYNASNALSQPNTESAIDSIEDGVIHKENDKTMTILDENDGIIYSPKAIIEQNKLFNSRRTSYNSNNTTGDIDDSAINALTQDYTPPLSFKGRPSSNSISSYFSNTNMTPTPIPSSNTFTTLTPGGAAGNPFLSAYKSSGTSSAEIKDDIDIYYHIFNDNLFEISMTLQVVKLMPHDFSTYNVTPQHNEENKYKKYYAILKEFKGAYLRIPKNHLNKLNIPNYEIINPKETSNNQLLRSKTKFYYLKIIRMGEIEELSSNNSWRSKTVLLTNCGILIYDSNKSSHHHTLIPSGSIFSDSSELFTTEVNRNDKTGESYYTVNFRSGFVMLFNDELYAETTKDESSYQNNDNIDNNEESKEKDYPFILWGTHGKSIWRCKNDFERSNWIDSINLIGCFHGTSNNYRCLNDTIVCKETETIGHRYYDLHIKNQKIIEKFNLIERELILFKQSIPISSKTRNDMINNTLNLSKKVKMLIREYRRNDCYNFIVDTLNLVKEVYPTDESESVIQTSAMSEDRMFSFNEDSLHTCFTENSDENGDHFNEPLDGSSLH